jgi:ABC-2 type transport system permease protein
LFRRIVRVLAVHFAAQAEYRATLAFWAVTSTMSFIMMGIWFGAADRGQISLTPDAVIRYFTAVYLGRELTDVDLSWLIEGDVLKGRFGHLLMMPLDPAWHYLAFEIAERLVRLPISFGVCLLVFVIHPPAVFEHDATTVVLVLAFCGLAFVLRFVLHHMIALLAFWTGRASALDALFGTAMMFLAGVLVPLDEFPSWLQQGLSYTPFPVMVWVPARLLAGGAAIDVLRWAVVGISWLVVIIALNRIVWWRARLRFAAVGG